ncbi:MAG: hypothetical protein ACK4SY_07120 [Pyrobaculum sp.]
MDGLRGFVDRLAGEVRRVVKRVGSAYVSMSHKITLLVNKLIDDYIYTVTEKQGTYIVARVFEEQERGLLILTYKLIVRNRHHHTMVIVMSLKGSMAVAAYVVRDGRVVRKYEKSPFLDGGVITEDDILKWAGEARIYYNEEPRRKRGRRQAAR